MVGLEVLPVTNLGEEEAKEYYEMAQAEKRQQQVAYLS